MKQKDEKKKEIIRELAANFYTRESSGQSLITITDVEIMSRGSRAVILFTTMPVSEEATALEFMKRKLSDFRVFVTENSRMMRIPYFDVAIDKGEKNRQRIEEISSKS